ncbi:MAG: hypothetical protein RL518_626 [Pseudomonadota bacterium]
MSGKCSSPNVGALRPSLYLPTSGPSHTRQRLFFVRLNPFVEALLLLFKLPGDRLPRVDHLL